LWTNAGWSAEPIYRFLSLGCEKLKKVSFWSKKGYRQRNGDALGILGSGLIFADLKDRWGRGKERLADNPSTKDGNSINQS